jgi:hypothetical protein
MPKDSKKKQEYPEPYWKQRQALKLKAAHSEQEKKDEKSKKKGELKVYYANQALSAPSKCENCKKGLQATINFHPRAHIAHIIAKTKEGGCPSVATHPKNKWYGCMDCHTLYDDSIFKKDFYVVVQMPVFPILVERFNSFKEEIKVSERKNVPLIFQKTELEAKNDSGRKQKGGKRKN